MKAKRKASKLTPRSLSLRAIPAMEEYDADFFKWTNTQANLLKRGMLDKLDVKNLIEEIESLGKRERSTLRSHITNWMLHMLKIKYQPNKRTKSWDKSIANARVEIEWSLKDSPSLKHGIKELFKDSYKAARIKAASETHIDIENFPEECPWKIQDVLK